ncbi:hypothetical protein [Aestuariicoccus sp. MJ-SS9]|uniref:hypothetical protein n=1 Tax=Aestuariicoccus sp. MJ-SS9 TaxID=3079855 RepID=UPI002908649D|nr:hypothetical protein [Aestuariicoccus sp. MJ-SS9]MDU8913396.1 hypothetical protein [Aestuariicoccus sp. MJ-SS9]
MKNSTPQNSHQNFGTTSLQTNPQKTISEKAGFGGKMFCEFGRFGPDPEFFNTILSIADLYRMSSLHRLLD